MKRYLSLLLCCLSQVSSFSASAAAAEGNKEVPSASSSTVPVSEHNPDTIELDKIISDNTASKATAILELDNEQENNFNKLIEILKNVKGKLTKEALKAIKKEFPVFEDKHLPMLNAIRGRFKNRPVYEDLPSRLKGISYAELNRSTREFNERKKIDRRGVLEILFGDDIDVFV